MQPWFLSSAKRALSEGIAAAVLRGDAQKDYRAALCRWEDDLFARFPAGHAIVPRAEAERLIAGVFRACGRRAPTLHLVPGFDDPRVGGFADVARHRIVIEEGCLYRFLVLHESAHILVPDDRRHGPVFTYVLQILYRTFFGIAADEIGALLARHGLPSYTDLPRLEPFAVAA